MDPVFVLGNVQCQLQFLQRTSSFFYGTSTKPTEADRLVVWQRCNDMVISWILNSLSRDISESVLYTANASALWIELNDRYSQVNGAKLYQLQKALCDISQGNNNIATYFSKLKATWDVLAALDEIPAYTCAASQLMVKREANQRLVQFLMGLNPSYDAVRGNILMMKPLPSISETHSLLIQDEKQREIHVASQFFPESSSMHVNIQKGLIIGRMLLVLTAKSPVTH